MDPADILDTGEFPAEDRNLAAPDVFEIFSDSGDSIAGPDHHLDDEFTLFESKQSAKDRWYDEIPESTRREHMAGEAEGNVSFSDCTYSQSRIKSVSPDMVAANPTYAALERVETILRNLFIGMTLLGSTVG
jgi:hypothetical protein